MKPSHRPRRHIVIAVALLAVGACGPAAEPDEPVIRPVRYERAAIRGGAETRTFSGTTRAEVESTLSFKVPGTLTRLSANVGDVVAG